MLRVSVLQNRAWLSGAIYQLSSCSRGASHQQELWEEWRGLKIASRDLNQRRFLGLGKWPWREQFARVHGAFDLIYAYASERLPG
jgi:hypothetical protein